MFLRNLLQILIVISSESRKKQAFFGIPEKYDRTSDYFFTNLHKGYALRSNRFFTNTIKIVNFIKPNSTDLAAALVFAVAFVVTPFATRNASGYALEGPKWPNGSNPVV